MKKIKAKTEMCKNIHHCNFSIKITIFPNNIQNPFLVRFKKKINTKVELNVILSCNFVSTFEDLLLQVLIFVFKSLYIFAYVDTNLIITCIWKELFSG